MEQMDDRCLSAAKSSPIGEVAGGDYLLEPDDFLGQGFL
ncbi:hypothetical protein EV690_0590 [Celerinatantimonas diazotrophica]|uniref:Uncharacterized protein n=1 Tax=Celerinatantimonas diazotrophica TaxID=412034 RepID=A0A4R1K8M7_9GAMM|nr:hypothetical protein EV690_0590 [Celerinatantimonas diazotrophica]CAG9295081.1 hypothetical protein CEDIAZO_00193 [Celerinatantimonas diazotrophica]